MIERFSTGPKFNANWANGGASAMSSASEMIAAMKDPMAAMARAEPARPCRAIW